MTYVKANAYYIPMYVTISVIVIIGKFTVTELTFLGLYFILSGTGHRFDIGWYVK